MTSTFHVLPPLLLIAFALSGCTSDPIESDEPGSIVARCCAEVRSRVASVKDIQSAQFNSRCNACRRGESKSGCASAAARLEKTIKDAYGSNSTPITCTTMKTSLQKHGIQ